ncbi:hypothetical protein EXIGLDRAFT_767253 [Exidia glandulosa HHB12029]|uniref:Uncharacterized protein n=1 Tax=Exidia glandulosa HHB12029 TaxID=1314781 RepID=A0A165J3Y6_EXIGL|nr:hypothetical protein EXIGLDRAFT_767253 [Exidia glandulosa HHB12029]
MLPNDYDSHGAGLRVDSVIKELLIHDRCEGPLLPSQWKQLYIEEESNFGIGAVGDEETLYLIWNGARLVLRMIGVLQTVNFAPFADRRITTEKVAYIQQFLILDGLLSDRYNTEIWALQDITDTLKETAPMKIDDDRNPTYATHLQVGTRMFVPRDDEHEQATTAISNLMDPNRKLRGCADEAGLVHTPMNSVEFLKRTNSEYVNLSPMSFKPGDIVEVHFSLALFKTSRNTLIPKLMLRSVASVDTAFTMLARRAMREKQLASGQGYRTLKRKRVETEPVYRPAKATRSADKEPAAHVTSGYEGGSEGEEHDTCASKSDGAGAVSEGFRDMQIE